MPFSPVSPSSSVHTPKSTSRPIGSPFSYSDLPPPSSSEEFLVGATGAPPIISSGEESDDSSFSDPPSECPPFYTPRGEEPQGYTEEAIYLRQVIGLERLGVLSTVNKATWRKEERQALKTMAAQYKYVASQREDGLEELIPPTHHKLLTQVSFARSKSRFRARVEVELRHCGAEHLVADGVAGAYVAPPATTLPLLSNRFIPVERRHIPGEEEQERQTLENVKLGDGTPLNINPFETVYVKALCLPKELMKYPVYPLEGINRYLYVGL